MKRIVLITGGFDPLHSGHIAYIKAAKELGDSLIVGINSDQWLRRKKGQEFMSWEERATIVSNLYDVSRVINFDDTDGSAKDAIRKVRSIYPNAQIIFANGGDRTKENIPEMDLLSEMLHLEFVFGVGGEDKKNSSSWILQEWKAPKTERPWGYYRVLHEVFGMKVKELTVDPGKSLSLQRHNLRSEYWIVSEGKCMVEHHGHAIQTDEYLVHTQLAKHQEFRIPQLKWHRLFNPYDEPCRIIEIQYGSKCEEEDIERR
jgi:cytidyltransferase-like protein